jgi:hypothetical protein
MPYLIDGHNLIPKIPGLSLQDLDDEQRLIDLLQAFCRARRQKVEVFFDQAPPGQAGSRQAGLVKVHFISRRSSADEAIRRRLERIGREAPNWKVVSSDRQVQAEARSRRAGVISSEAFTEELLTAARGGEHERAEGAAPAPDEIAEWLRIFQKPREK